MISWIQRILSGNNPNHPVNPARRAEVLAKAGPKLRSSIRLHPRYPRENVIFSEGKRMKSKFPLTRRPGGLLTRPLSSGQVSSVGRAED